MSTREQAISNIKSELHKEGKAFIAYRTDLNKVIKEITKEYIQLQQQVK